MTQPTTNERQFQPQPDFMLSPAEPGAAPTNKRHWTSTTDDFPPKTDNDVNMILFGKSAQMNMNQIHPSKRSCMMTSYMEPTNTADEHQWMIDPCQQNVGYDFMATGNHLDANADKRTWNGTNAGPANAIGMNGMACDNNGDALLSLELDHKKHGYGPMSVKANELERDLLGLSTHSAASNMNTNAVLMQMQQQQQQHQQQLHAMHDHVFRQAATSSNNAGPSQLNSDSAPVIGQGYVFICCIKLP